MTREIRGYRAFKAFRVRLGLMAQLGHKGFRVCLGCKGSRANLEYRGRQDHLTTRFLLPQRALEL